MPLAPVIPVSFADRRLVPLVLSHAVFAQRGYLWGFDGEVHYCFFNPDKIRFELWKKQWYWRAFLVPLIGGALTWMFGGLGFWLTLWVPFMAYKHYYKTAEDQAAGVVTNGPQMELPWGLTFDSLKWLAILSLGIPTVIGLVLGAVVGWIGSIPGVALLGLAGLATGASLYGVLMTIIGLFAKPFGTVLAPTFSEIITSPMQDTAHFERTGLPFPTYAIGPLNPTATPGCGGLDPFILNGVAGYNLPGQMGSSYADVISRDIPEVVWGLIPLDLQANPILGEAMSSQEYWYAGKHPTGIVVVAGAEAWKDKYTQDLVMHGTRDAVATDGSQSALLGSSGQMVIGGAWNPLNAASYRDWIQRYGMMAVPE